MNYNQNGLLIDWDCVYYGNQQSIDYYYKLEGLNDEWVHNGNLNRVSFNNLKSGSYDLKIKAIALGKNIEVSIFQFSIKSPF